MDGLEAESVTPASPMRQGRMVWAGADSMGSDYQRFDAPHLDYALWDCPFDKAVKLRGPPVDRTRPYIAASSAESVGDFRLW